MEHEGTKPQYNLSESLNDSGVLLTFEPVVDISMAVCERTSLQRHLDDTSRSE